MNTWVEAPPPQRGMGCFAKGCLTVVALIILLVAAFVGGGYWAVWHLRNHYSAATSTPLPRVTLTQEQIGQVSSQWEAFTAAAQRHRRARIELTAEDVNALIASEPDWHGKAFVTLDNSLGRARLSIPIGQVGWLKDRFLNAECTVRPAPSRNPAEAKLTNIVLAGNRVSDEVIDYQMFGWKSVRSVIADWCAENDLGVFDIVDGKVVLETRGSE